MADLNTATSRTNTAISRDAITGTTSSARDLTAPTLESVLQESRNAYTPATDAMQKQIQGVDSRLETTLSNLAREYSAQQAQLNSQRNAASTSASLQAALTGGGFGGQAELAKRKYYANSFVPAQTQLNTNLSTDRANARQQAEDSRLSLQQSLANLEAEAAAYGLQRYDTGYQYANTYNQQNAFQRDALAEANKNRLMQYGSQQDSLEEAYKQRLLQQWQTEENNKTTLKAAKSSNWQTYIPSASSTSSGSSSTYDGSYDSAGNWTFTNTSTGNNVKLGTAVASMGGDFNSNLKSQLQIMVDETKDANAQKVLNAINSGTTFARNSGSGFSSTGNGVLDTLGIKVASGVFSG